jgi:NADPH:quinone reductase-like Zn-dependent oxidoreductase
MKAVLIHAYGPPDVLRVEEVARPTAADDEVLVAVRAASVNPFDWHLMRGAPLPVRVSFGLGAPKDPRFGVDLAGTVVALGAKVTRFHLGDAVFGAARGACAEYACVRESRAALKPEQVTFEQAAAVPIAGSTALQALRDKGQVRPGQRVLINGAAGGVGTFAVQIAKALGAHVTAVTSTRNVDLVRSLGADRVLDYTRDDFTQGGPRYDVLLDAVGNRALSGCRRVLLPGGIYVVVGGPFAVVKTLALSRLLRAPRLVAHGATITPTDLTALAGLMERAAVTPVIDRHYPLSDVSEAIRSLEAGHAQGKVTITVDGVRA